MSTPPTTSYAEALSPATLKAHIKEQDKQIADMQDALSTSKANAERASIVSRSKRKALCESLAEYHAKANEQAMTINRLARRDAFVTRTLLDIAGAALSPEAMDARLQTIPGLDLADALAKINAHAAEATAARGYCALWSHVPAAARRRAFFFVEQEAPHDSGAAMLAARHYAEHKGAGDAGSIALAAGGPVNLVMDEHAKY